MSRGIKVSPVSLATCKQKIGRQNFRPGQYLDGRHQHVDPFPNLTSGRGLQTPGELGAGTFLLRIAG